MATAWALNILITSTTSLKRKPGILPGSQDWDSYLSCLANKGRFHIVGIVPEPVVVPSFSLINGGKSIAGSPGGSPALIRTMLDFCVRHNIYPIVEEFPMEKVNEAIRQLQEGKARYRIVLKHHR
ncbi:zinc-binding dehydrogenase [uncultured Chitinophaga sp.]|uniref:zinc-binding dehydrogenase n=1 Tax=uncultured Chitinophaga sp. TaxID=339340 RepID=UPI00345706DC